MNISEAVRLLRKVKAYRPHQEMDEFTAEAWAEILEDVEYRDADEAIKQLGSEIPYIGCDDIAKRVRVIRSKRVNQHEADLVPNPDFTVPEYLAWLKDARRRLANGETAAEVNGNLPALTARRAPWSQVAARMDADAEAHDVAITSPLEEANPR